MGLRTISVLAERPEDDLTAQCVLSLGGDMVMHDTYLHTKVDIYTYVCVIQRKDGNLNALLVSQF